MSLEVGDRVGDIEDESDSGEAVVVNMTGNPAMDYHVNVGDERQSVAELNKGYDPMSEVISVVFEEELRRNIPKWAFLDEEGLERAVSNCQVRVYQYPRDRLSRLNRALVDGVVVRVDGVADPIGEDAGAYAYSIEKEMSDVIEQGSGYLSVYDNELDYVSSSTSCYFGLLEALDWVKSNIPDSGVLIRLDDNSIVNELSGDYEVRSSDDKRFNRDISDIMSELPYVEFQEIVSSDNEDLHERAVSVFHENGEDDASDVEYDIENVVDDEYIVDGMFAVNLSQKTCTCGKSEECEHLEAVMSVV